MLINSKFNQLANKPDLVQLLKSALNKNAYDLNVCRIGIVEEFYPENLTVKVKIAGKKTIGTNKDGSQKTEDFAPIYAKVCYCAPFITFPIVQGMECILLFNDREIETWFINGGANPEKYPRMHELTDAVAIFGIRSLPLMIQIMTDCLHLFYGQSGIYLKEEQTVISTPQTDITSANAVNISAETINLNGDVIINGQKYMAHAHTNGNEGSPTGGVIP